VGKGEGGGRVGKGGGGRRGRGGREPQGGKGEGRGNCPGLSKWIVGKPTGKNRTFFPTPRPS
jgi:hypothetical protein